jgi:hypothetical protein
MFADLKIAAIGMAGNASGLFQGILPFALLAVLVVVVVHLIWTLTHRRPAGARSPWGWWARLVYLGTLGSVAVLGVTSFVAMIRFGALGGWWLFIHMFGAGAFTVALPVLALTWCQANRFGCSAQPACDEGQAPTSRFPCLAKAMFWVILAAGLVVTGTMLLSMLPLFGTQGLELLLDVHRYAGLAVVAAMILHLYAALLPRFGLS